MAFGNYEIVKV